MDTVATNPPLIVNPAMTPSNTILYVPSGTGKTYFAFRRPVELCYGLLPSGIDESAVGPRYDELHAPGRHSFVTFHPSFRNEVFVEGVRPRLPGLRVAADLACGACDRLVGRRAPSSRPLRHHLRPQLRVGRQHPVVLDRELPRPRHPCRQLSSRSLPRRAGGAVEVDCRTGAD